MESITITSTHYHMRYDTRYIHFLSGLHGLGLFATGYHVLLSNLYKKMYINIFLNKLTVARGNPLQVAQDQANLRENIQYRVW